MSEGSETIIISFGRIPDLDSGGSPKKKKVWVWTCACDQCAAKVPRILHGPFPTLKAAERDAGQMVSLMTAERGGPLH